MTPRLNLLLFDKWNVYLKIYKETDYWIPASHCLVAIYKTKRLKYWELILKYNWFKPLQYIIERDSIAAVEAVSELVLPYADLEEQFAQVSSYNSFRREGKNLSTYFISKGIYLERICAVASEELKEYLLQ